LAEVLKMPSKIQASVERGVQIHMIGSPNRDECDVKRKYIRSAPAEAPRSPLRQLRKENGSRLDEHGGSQKWPLRIDWERKAVQMLCTRAHDATPHRCGIAPGLAAL